MRADVLGEGRRGVPRPWGWEMLWTLTARYALNRAALILSDPFLTKD